MKNYNEKHNLKYNLFVTKITTKSIAKFKFLLDENEGFVVR